MNNTQRKRRLLISAMAGMLMIPGNAIMVQAEEETTKEVSPLPVAGIEDVLEQYIENEVKDNIDLYLVQTEKGEYLNRAFSNVSDLAYIRIAPDENAEWVGKLYSDSTVTVLEYIGDWTKIQSGNVEGYVPAEVLYTGEEAQMRQEEYIERTAIVTANVLNVRDGQGTEYKILTQILQDESYQVKGEPINGWYPICVGEMNGWVCGDYITVKEAFSYAESKEEEQQRLEAEAAADEAIEESLDEKSASVAVSYTSTQGSIGQAIIEFACQFIGNPYIWGGTSLTNGADCSGFVQSVYANFGINLPRTTWEMENSGYEVSYEEALPGDLVLYDGHVGLYMGDGTIVNAMNEVDGIGICSATYAPIVTIRRVI